MQIIKKTKKIKSGILTLGNFDGVHLGHQEILKKVKTRAELLGCPSIVYTFEPHPIKVVAPHKHLPLITTLDDKIELIKEFGIDFLFCARFTKEFASQHPREFVKNELIERLNVQEVWVGHDYAFGRSKLGTVDYLKELGEEFGFKAHVVPAFKKLGIIVSSSRIRETILNGDVKKAKSLLGRFYSISGRVIKGKNRGKQMGFPTANIDTQNELIPKNGVYAVFCEVNPVRKLFSNEVKGLQYPAVVNIGTNPTFENGDNINIEVHIMDFNRSLYGKRLKIHFVQRIRDEIKFKTVDELVKQIKRDVKKANSII
ncbi:MAG: bifunctional riboflavin kinase/FAD synthetase [Deltaproteobacteria bacterium]|nr:bifunctional riboflavin kinase/FAD synthetase [Deltaproteobacteria bacterium]